MTIVVILTSFLSIILMVNFILMIFLIAGIVKLNIELEKVFLEFEKNHDYFSFLMEKNDLKKQ